ncbi:MAG: hypothetical protein ACLFNO_00825 [Parcubacteria group bacterium]
MTEIKTITEQKTFEVTANFSDALIAIKDDEQKIGLIKAAETRSVGKTMIDSIIRGSFVVKLFPFKSREDLKSTFEKENYSPATVFELISFLHQFPEFKNLNIVAEGSWRCETGGDIFNFVNRGKSTNKNSLGYECFNFCCLEKRTNEGYYVLGLKN